MDLSNSNNLFSSRSDRKINSTMKLPLRLVLGSDQASFGVFLCHRFDDDGDGDGDDSRKDFGTLNRQHSTCTMDAVIDSSSIRH